MLTQQAPAGACFIFGLVYMQVVNYPANKAKPEQTMQYDLIIIGAAPLVPLAIMPAGLDSTC